MLIILCIISERVAFIASNNNDRPTTNDERHERCEQQRRQTTTTTEKRTTAKKWCSKEGTATSTYVEREESSSREREGKPTFFCSFGATLVWKSSYSVVTDTKCSSVKKCFPLALSLPLKPFIFPLFFYSLPPGSVFYGSLFFPLLLRSTMPRALLRN